MAERALDASGIPLTPLIARRIIVRCFEERQQWMRQDLVTRVEREHLAAGGLLGRQPTRTLVKRALSDLRAENSVSPVSKGIWRSVIGTQEDQSGLDLRSAVNVDGENDKEPDFEPGVKQIGSGSGSLYLYFNGNDRKLAEYEQRNVWECKVGHTSGDVWSRLRDQGIRASQSQLPTLGLIIKTDDPAELEGILHRCLRLADCSVPNAAVEWFFTSPERVEAWYMEFVKAIAAINPSAPPPPAHT
jgi:hypothetical protein